MGLKGFFDTHPKRVLFNFAVAIGIASTVLCAACRVAVSESEKQMLEFPFEVKEHTKKGIGTFDIVSLNVILPREHYSRKNLDTLFTTLSRRYPDRKDRLEIYVYTDAARLNNMKVKEPEPIYEPVTPTVPSPKNKPDKGPVDLKARVVPHDAVFYRQGDGAAIGGGENEWYIYSPSLDAPNRTERVVLRGIDPLSPSQVLESWETSHRGKRFRIDALELKYCVPAKTYFSLESFNPTHEEWKRILAAHVGDETNIPREQLRFVGDRVIYFFIGGAYAATSNAGEEWFTWRAQDHLKDIETARRAIIKAVEVAENGTGTMTLGWKESADVQTLYTTDFGKTWR